MCTFTLKLRAFRILSTDYLATGKSRSLKKTIAEQTIFFQINESKLLPENTSVCIQPRYLKQMHQEQEVIRYLTTKMYWRFCRAPGILHSYNIWALSFQGGWPKRPEFLTLHIIPQRLGGAKVPHIFRSSFILKEGKKKSLADKSQLPKQSSEGTSLSVCKQHSPLFPTMIEHWNSQWQIVSYHPNWIHVLQCC